MVGNSSELKALFPDRDLRKAIKLEYGVFDREREELLVLHDAGFFSCVSVTVWSICELLAAGHVPKAINFTGTLSLFKDGSVADVYPDFFEMDLSTAAIDEMLQYEPSRFKRFDHHGDYNDLDHELLSLLIRTYLQLNPIVTERADLLRLRYLVPDRRYVGVCIRGTDKALEVPPTDSSFYVEAVDQLLERDQVDRVLIQTDQAQVCELFRSYFNDKCDVFENLPRTTGRVAIHHLPETRDGRGGELAKNMLAAVSTISTMRHIVTHTGNIGAWIVLMRGSSTHVRQATPDGIVELGARRTRPDDRGVPRSGGPDPRTA